MAEVENEWIMLRDTENEINKYILINETSENKMSK